MAEKKVRTRVQSKHDVEKNWASATFAPLPGEIIIYDKDKGVNGGTHEKPRIKVGDGTTAVGSLPFVVDKEATDAAIAAVEADLQGALKEVSVSGRKVTFTKFDGTKVDITTQDTNSDTKVTNTQNNTVKAYVTGTTNAEATSAQVFDSTIYIDSEEGKLVAKKFQGKAMQDDLGNTISTTYETKADAAEAYEDLRRERRDALANMNKEAYLTWGGKNIDGAVGPVGASLSAEHSANRLAYLNPAALSFETSNNSGSTWSSMSMSNADKIKLVTTASNALKVGTANPVTAGNRTRMTLTAATSSTTYVYTRPKKLLLDVSSPHGIKVLVEYKTGASGASWQTLTNCTISGWSAWNEIDLSALSTLGGSPTQTSNIWYLRLTFYVIDAASINSKYASSLPHIPSIRLFGDTCWTETSNLGKTGHLYSYDESQNATFPAKVTATQFVGPLQGNAATATSATSATKATSDGNGNNIVNTYATKTALQHVAEPSKTISGPIASNGSKTINITDAITEPHNIIVEVTTEAADQKLWELRAGSSTLITDSPASLFARPLSSIISAYLSENTQVKGLGLDAIYLNPDDIACTPSPESFISKAGAAKLDTTDTSQTATYNLLGVFYSTTEDCLFITKLSCFYSQTAGTTGSFYIDSDLGKLYIDGPDGIVSSRVKTTYNVPKDLVLYTIGYNWHYDYIGGPDLVLYSSANLYGMTCDANFLDDLLLIDEPGVYQLPYQGNYADSLSFDFSSPIAANYSVSYLQDTATSAIQTIKHVRECNSKNFAEELSKAISSGRSDPDSSTPGLLYFKYL